MKPLPNIIKFDKLGTHWECEIFDDINNNELVILKNKILEIVDKFENNYSRFLPDSLLSILNRNYEILNQPTEMTDMFVAAREVGLATGGVFNLSVGGKLNELGYGSRKLTSGIVKDFWYQTVIEKDIISIPTNSYIDLGGVGKGWLIDIISNFLKNYNIDNFIVNGGGDLYVDSKNPIKISLEDPRNSKLSVGQTYIKKGALACSSSIKRSWGDGKENYHHIINPKTGKPSDSGVIGAFVKAENAAIADMIATVLIIDPKLEQLMNDKFGSKSIIIKN